MVKVRNFGEDRVFMIGGKTKSWTLEEYSPSEGKWIIKQSYTEFSLGGVVGFRQGFIRIFEPNRFKSVSLNFVEKQPMKF